MVESTRNCWLMMRIDPAEKEEYKKEAEKRGITLSDLMKNALEWYKLRNIDESHK
jgi:antitoxin component of RelBE/YafQ-DinJ toxin-antitoxin module